MPTSTFSPVADITTDWGIVGGGTHASAVLTDDADAKYIFRTFIATGTDVWSGAFDVAIPVGATISVVKSIARGRSTTLNAVAHGDETAFIVRIGGTNYGIPGGGTDSWHGTSYFTVTRLWNTNPSTGLFWTFDDFIWDGMGISKDIAEAAVGQVRITQQKMTVDWDCFPVTDEDIALFWRLQRLIRKGLLADVRTDPSQAKKFFKYRELRGRAIFNGQSMEPAREFIDGDYEAGLRRAHRRFR